MSQHQARVPVKRLRQTALTWKVKDKATSQLARSDARLADRSQWRKLGETERDCPPKSFGWGHSSVDSSQSSDFGGSVPGLASLRSQKEHITFYNCEAVSVKFHLYYDQCGV